ncbi:MAG: hypothetical protein FRX49_02115 [Trebouxia sp. A1-2]|nr:MAG: hypothetical protein FRX49_02115 [Trebouxia sp. A1-2]
MANPQVWDGPNPERTLKLKQRVVEVDCWHQAKRHFSKVILQRCYRTTACSHTTRVVNSAHRPDKGKKAAGVGRLAKVPLDEVLGGSSGPDALLDRVVRVSMCHKSSARKCRPQAGGPSATL